MNQNINRMLLPILALTLSPGLATAGEKRILFGAQSEPDGSTYEVGFCARAKNNEGNGPGHAFVVLMKFDKDNRRTEFLTAGFGPPESRPVHPHGLISPENYSHPTQECLIAETNKAKYTKVMSGIESETTYSFAGTTINLTRPYMVAFDDCVTFLQSVAREFGLIVPSRITGLLPVAYVKSLKAEN
ncbi:MAG: hypothetical protein AB2559_15685 [Candidatus Thiodiazotropha endolucinida]